MDTKSLNDFLNKLLKDADDEYHDIICKADARQDGVAATVQAIKSFIQDVETESIDETENRICKHIFYELSKELDVYSHNIGDRSDLSIDERCEKFVKSIEIQLTNSILDNIINIISKDLDNCEQYEYHVDNGDKLAVVSLGDIRIWWAHYSSKLKSVILSQFDKV